MRRRRGPGRRRRPALRKRESHGKETTSCSVPLPFRIIHPPVNIPRAQPKSALAGTQVPSPKQVPCIPNSLGGSSQEILRYLPYLTSQTSRQLSVNQSIIDTTTITSIQTLAHVSMHTISRNLNAPNQTQAHPPKPKLQTAPFPSPSPSPKVTKPPNRLHQQQAA